MRKSATTPRRWLSLIPELVAGFGIVGMDVASFTFSVFDRWGNTMYSSSQKNFKWDGSFKGMTCNSGVYAYIVDVVYLNGKKETLSGNITLIR